MDNCAILVPMRPYSVDLRERVIAAIEEGKLSQPQIALLFQVSLGTVENWWRRWRNTGDLTPTVATPGPERTLQGCAATIRTHLQHQPDATLQELCDMVHTQHQLRASPSMMSRELQILELPRKKIVARQPTRHRTRPNPTRRAPRQNRADFAGHRRTPQIHR